MLVLSRRVQESVDIPEAGIRIKVLAVRGNRVRIGIEAPGDLDIVRSELLIPSTGSSGHPESELCGVPA